MGPRFLGPRKPPPQPLFSLHKDGGAVRHLAGMPRMIFGAASATDAYHELTWSVTWMIYPHEPYSGYSGLLKRAIFLPNRWEIFRVLQIEMCLFAGYLWVSSKIISAKEAPDQARSASAKGEGWARHGPSNMGWIVVNPQNGDDELVLFGQLGNIRHMRWLFNDDEASNVAGSHTFYRQIPEFIHFTSFTMSRWITSPGWLKKRVPVDFGNPWESFRHSQAWGILRLFGSLF
jgi:hypothetical protein